MSSPLRHTNQIELLCHRQRLCPFVRSIAVALGHDAAGLHLAYCLTGDLAQLRLPAASAPAAAGRLWAQTCFEAFIAASSDDGYREWNFSPSGQWDHYTFSGYRERALPNESAGAPATPAIHVDRTTDSIQLDAHIALPPWRCATLAIGLSTVVEDIDGGLSYWALAHPSARPDFHSRAGFALSLDLATNAFFI
ncbi:MAG: DOMON-like domain-containing protein [Sterolibacteriaceae bacterium]|nr:DOMON-like domain-containing protein [Candidatus Methylophosphatis haderslevensis]